MKNKNNTILDIFGRQLSHGDTVAYSHFNQLYVGTIVRVTEKMIRVRPISTHSKHDHLKWPKQAVLVDSALVTMYALKSAG
jgi:hypothetical protein